MSLQSWPIIRLLPERFLPFLSLTLLGCLPVLSPLSVTSAEAPARLKRSQAFLGIHFDFHAGPDCKIIGKNTTREMIEGILDRVKPDYLQIDCKGHPGFSSYPTKVGNQAPGFVGDPLRLWRTVTAEKGVSLYMHYSGIWDSEAIRLHPEWGVTNADGKLNTNAIRPGSPYADKLLIPQLQELAGEYGVDGAWVDGECWATVPDYSAATTEAFTKASGIQEIPKKAGDTNWLAWMSFHREEFRKYLRHYVAELKKSHPAFELCSNWAFSEFMPEPVGVDLAFLSGDFTPQDSLNSARFSARCLANQGKPWDLMAWSFSGKEGGYRPQKSAVQLQQEASVVLAQGGGFQAYFVQKRDGSIYDWQMDTMAEVARFCRQRQEWCHRQEIVPQVALLLSTASHYKRSPQVFSPWGSAGISSLKGVLQSLLSSQLPVQVVSEHHLTGKMSKWPIIVIPEWEELDPSFRDELLEYVRGGGRLLAVGPKSAAAFKEQLDVNFSNELQVSGGKYLSHRGSLAAHNTLTAKARLGTLARPFGRLYPSNEPKGVFDPAASIAPLGTGFIAATYVNFGERHLNARTPTAGHFLRDLIREMVPEMQVEVTGSQNVDVSLGRKNGRYIINLVNTAGPHENEKQYVYDEVPSIGPLEIKLRLAQEPKEVKLEPGSRNVRYEYLNGIMRMVVPHVDLYEMVVVKTE